MQQFIDVRKDPDHGHALIFTGTTEQLADMVDDVEDAAIVIAGFSVTKAHRTAQHDGRPAVGFTLSDDIGARDVGRLVLLTDVDWHEEALEWRVEYYRDSDADENLAILTARKDRPKVSRIELDLSFNRDGGEDPDEVIAEWASEYGISFHLITEHGPAGGNPLYEVSGLTENIERFLTGPYDLEPTEVSAYLDE